MQTAIDAEEKKPTAIEITASEKAMDTAPDESVSAALIEQKTGDPALSQIDTPDVPIRFAEKKRLHWSGKTCKCHSFAL